METGNNYKTGKTLRGLLWMSVLAGLVVIFVSVVNWLPSLREDGFARQYASIEEARRSLELDTVVVPAFFPEGISWPPSFILAQNKPFPAVVMEFTGAETRETALIIIQSSSRSSDVQLQRIRMSEVKEETLYQLNGMNVLLQVGVCDNGIPCSKMTWQDNSLSHTLLYMSSPFELIRIVESMIHSK
jgi:hypothetical protein